MNNVQDILMVLSSIGVINSVYFIIILLKEKKGNPLLNKLLALVILAYTVRIGKSVIFYFSDEGLNSIVINMGFAAFFMIGPFLYFYFLVFTKQNDILKWKYVIHLVPSFIVLLFCWLIPYSPGNYLWKIGYLGIMIQKFIYLILASFHFIQYLKQTEREGLKAKIWLSTLLISVFIVWLAYFLHFPLRLGSYINGAVAYTFIIYFALYQWHTLNKKGTHLHDISVKNYFDEEQMKYFRCVIDQLEIIMVDEKQYKNPNLTIDILSKKLKIPSYKLSKIINSYFHQNFNEFINDYRIEDAKRMLSNHDCSNLTIAAIAYEVGFNSLSTFNDAFKKREKQTPSTFRITYFKFLNS